MDARGRFELHMPGLLKVLAEHLYSTQRVGVRELIQNAHDSCVRRAVEGPPPGFCPRIDLSVDPASHVLRVADNGCGLTEQEILTYLTVIGCGYTRELRDRLEAADPSASWELIGQFGIGFISAFLIASHVTVQTRSSDGPPLRWTSSGDQHYDLTAGDRTEIGTTIELRLKPSAIFLLHEPNLLDVVREYADFLPIPIHVNGSPDRANLGVPPWKEPDAEAACRAYVRRRYGEADPLWVWALTDGIIDLGHDTLTVPLRGFLFVPSQSVASIKEYGTVSVYIRGMAICDEDKGLLPAWARFVRAVIDCPALQPTASREAVHQEDAFAATRRVIDDQLSRGLRELAARQPVIWRRVVHGHSDVIMGWAAKDAEFFRMVADVVPLRTSRGRLALPEYLKESGNILYYTTHELGSLQEKVLAEGRDVPAIDASWFAVPQFLQHYAELHPRVSLVRLDDDLRPLLRPAPTAELSELVRLCEELGFAACASSFRPSCLPAVMTYPADAEMMRDAATALEQGEIPDGFSGLLHNYVENRHGARAQAGMLHLNAACPLIRRLARPEVAPARKQAALAVVAYFARLFCGRMLDASRAAADLEIWQRSLDRLV
jgi:molecular chaperone HtpG